MKDQRTVLRPGSTPCGRDSGRVRLKSAFFFFFQLQFIVCFQMELVSTLPLSLAFCVKTLVDGTRVPTGPLACDRSLCRLTTLALESIR